MSPGRESCMTASLWPPGLREDQEAERDPGVHGEWPGPLQSCQSTSVGGRGAGESTPGGAGMGPEGLSSGHVSTDQERWLTHGKVAHGGGRGSETSGQALPGRRFLSLGRAPGAQGKAVGLSPGQRGASFHLCCPLVSGPWRGHGHCVNAGGRRSWLFPPCCEDTHGACSNGID